MLEIEKFIMMHENWRELLAAPPYSLSIREEDGLISLKYNQIESDFSYKLVRECRGIIFYADTLEVACLPFYKFFNYGEVWADDIDWTTAKISEKMDGSLVKVFWRRDKKCWQVASNGTTNVYNVPLRNPEILEQVYGVRYNSMGDLFDEAAKKQGLNFKKLNIAHTYMFELCTPCLQVVIKYPETSIWHIGTRDMTTRKEIEEDIGIKKPKEYSFGSIEECIESASAMRDDQEGYVVRDSQYRRIKIKSPKYCLWHHMAFKNVVDNDTILDIVKENEASEFLSYFPEYKELVEKMQEKFSKVVEYINDKAAILLNANYETRKDFVFAAKALEDGCFAYYMCAYDNKTDGPRAFLSTLSVDKLATLINKVWNLINI